MKRRSGILAKKLGMMRLFENNCCVPVTVLALENCMVVAQRLRDQHGYTALQIGIGVRKMSRLSKSLKGYFAGNDVEPRAMLQEFRVDAEYLITPGTLLQADHFLLRQHVDVCAFSIGKGFQGAMKRHHFSGLRATHGVSLKHRSPGSTGQNQDPGKVFKGKKMAGHMGAARRTIQNLSVVRIDLRHNLIFVCGAVPGAKGGYVRITDAIKKPLSKDAPVPTSTSLLLSPSSPTSTSVPAHNNSDDVAKEEVAS